MFRRYLSKKYLFLVFAIVIICSFIFWQYASRSEDVYMRVVTPEDGPELSESMTNWITQEKAFVGIHAYGREGSGFYELLVLDNRHQLDNLYLHTEAKSRIENGVLTIELTDSDATSDSEVQYNEELYFILKEKPKEIKVVVDGNPYEVALQSGGMPITN